MEENEEIIKQEEVEEEVEGSPSSADSESDGSVPRDAAPGGKDSASSSEQETATQEAEMSPRRPKSTGVLLTVFAIIVIVLVGALASYYYYTFQRQGMASGQVLANVWDETVLVTIELTDSFDQIDAFEDIDDVGKDSFEDLVNNANRTIRDGTFDIRSQTGMDISTSSFASKLNSFLDDYSNMLAELKRIIARVEEINSTDELDQVLVYQEDMEKSYDDLLLVSGRFIQANLPRSIFDMPDDIKNLLRDQLDEEGTQEEQNKADRQAAEQAVSQFVQAWQNRDGDGMSGHLTAGAKGEFNPGILEDSSDIVSFRILNTTLSGDGASMEINGRLDKKTPDDVDVSEEWKFVLLKNEDNWLIDSWNQS